MVAKSNDQPGTRTQNLQIRSLARYHCAIGAPIAGIELVCFEDNFKPKLRATNLYIKFSNHRLANDGGSAATGSAFKS